MGVGEAGHGSPMMQIWKNRRRIQVKDVFSNGNDIRVILIKLADRLAICGP